MLCNLTGDTAKVTVPAGWENADVLLNNYSWDRAARELKPYECVALLK